MTSSAPAAIITGGGSGIGRATAHAFADRGFEVLVVGRTPATLAATAEGRANVHTLVVDITTAEAPDAVANAARDRLGRVDVLVNNAAAACFGALDSLDRAAVHEQLATNLLAPVFLTQALLKDLEATAGLVVNIGSAGALGLRSWPQNAVYGATKAGLDHLTRSWAVELGPRRIRVVGVAPGVVDSGVGVRTGMSEAAYAGFLEAMAQRTPGGRVGTPEEIAWWIVRLSEPEAGFVSGTTVTVDGALSVT